MTDLVASDQQYLMQVVMAVEAALRALLQPEKINLASLGNQVPHLHWHIIPRFADDPHFPDPIWSGARRVGAKKEIDPGLIKVALVTNLKKQVK